MLLPLPPLFLLERDSTTTTVAVAVEETERGILVPLLLLERERDSAITTPVAVCFQREIGIVLCCW